MSTHFRTRIDGFHRLDLGNVTSIGFHMPLPTFVIWLTIVRNQYELFYVTSFVNLTYLFVGENSRDDHSGLY